jgi:HD-GYP domain-containing protein (c-di-GMP phosphodiesterase class II)
MLKSSLKSLPILSDTDQKEWLKLVASRKTNHSIVNSLLTDIWDKSFETKEHGERMAAYAWQIGKKIGLPQSQLQDLVLLARVHDIGKTMISNKILNKAGPLDELEWAEMKMHTIFGYRIAQLTPDIRPVSDGILFHHERWDGDGYPHGLSGLTIPLQARIIAVVDAFDTMTHDRSYRQAVEAENAIWELRMKAGKQFDPTIVDIFAGLM